MAKDAFNKKRALFTSIMDLKLGKKLVKCYIWSILLQHVVLEKDGEDQLDRSCEKLRSITYSQGAEEYPT